MLILGKGLDRCGGNVLDPECGNSAAMLKGPTVKTQTTEKPNPLAIVPPVPRSEPMPEGKGKPRAPRKARALPNKAAKPATLPKKVSDKMRRDLIFANVAKAVPADETTAVAPFLAAIPRIERDVVRLETGSLAAMAIALRPVVAWLVSPKAAKAQITTDANAARRLIAWLKANTGKGNLVRVQHGTAHDAGVPISVKRQMPWERVGSNATDATNRMTRAAQAALLAAYPESGVTIGYSTKPPGTFRAIYTAKAPGKKGEPVYAGICAPSNVLQPVVYGSVSSEKETGKGFPGERPIANNDTRLLGLDADLIEALYLVHFGNVEPHYETHVMDRNLGVPTGMLVPFRGPRVARKPDAGTGTPTGTAEGTTIPDPEQVHKAALAFRDLPVTQWPTTTKSLEQHMYAHGFAFACLLNKACAQGSMVAKSFAGSKAAAVSADILRCLSSVMRVNPDGSADLLKDDQRFRVASEDTLPPTTAQTAKPAKPAKARKGKAA